MTNTPFWTLAVETSTLAASVCVMDGDEVVVETTVRTGRGHASKLLPSIERALAEAGVRLCVSCWSFRLTGVVYGIRILRLESPPVRQYTSGRGFESDALAVGLGPSGNFVASIIDARKGEVFVAVYAPSTDGKRTRLGEPFVSKPERALEEIDSRCGDQEVLFVGNGLAEYPTIFGERLCAAPMFNRVRAAALAHLNPRVSPREPIPCQYSTHLFTVGCWDQVGAPQGGGKRSFFRK